MHTLGPKELENIVDFVKHQLRNYTLSPLTKNMEWHKDTTLRGMCAIGSLLLQNILKKQSVVSQIFYGIFDLETAGADTRRIKPKQRHCWCEVQIGNNIWIADPTICQFYSWMPGSVIKKTKGLKKKANPQNPQNPKDPQKLQTAQKALCPYQEGIPMKHPSFKGWPEWCHPKAKNKSQKTHIEYLIAEVQKKSPDSINPYGILEI